MRCERHRTTSLAEIQMTDNVEIDPVCGMEVDPANAVGHSEFEDRVYYFCSRECKEKFELGPADFADVA
jgi:Cu+-exporting ATPase